MQNTEEPHLDNTVPIFLHQTKIRSQIIYIITLLSVLFAIAALPFIYTTVSVKSPGSLQSNIEKSELLAPTAGRIVQLNLKDNEKVKKGKVLMKIDATSPIQQSSILEKKIIQLERLLHDAILILKLTETKTSQQNLITGFYIANWQQYDEQIQNEFNTKEQAFRVFKRYETLYNRKVITQVEYEDYKFKYEQSSSSLELTKKKYLTQWQNEVNQYRNELRDLQNQNIQLTEQKKSYILTAPISGSLQNLSGLHVGSFILANQKIGEISSDSSLLAFCYLKPSDIGLIKVGQAVRFQIDAFNYNQWGSLTGTVADISADIIILNQLPYFKVKCQLNKDILLLKNGYRGQVKKGMTFTARFTVIRRSLYQLLFDKIDDWLNPNGQTSAGT